MNTLFLGSYVLLWIVVALLGAALYILYSHVGQRLLNSHEGRMLQGPDLERRVEPHVLPDLSGVRHGVGGPTERPTLLLYLSMNCSPCRHLLHALPKVVDRFGEQLDTVVVCRGKFSQVQSLTAGLPKEIAVRVDEKGVLVNPYRILVTPFALSLDRDGVLRYKGVPGSDIDNLIHFISPLLSEEIQTLPPTSRRTPEALVQI